MRCINLFLYYCFLIKIEIPHLRFNFALLYNFIKVHPEWSSRQFFFYQTSLLTTLYCCPSSFNFYAHTRITQLKAWLQAFTVCIFNIEFTMIYLPTHNNAIFFVSCTIPETKRFCLTIFCIGKISCPCFINAHCVYIHREILIYHNSP